MKRKLRNIIMMLLALPAAFSCSADMSGNMKPGISAEAYSLIISGVVSDKESSLPLEGIKISFSAYLMGQTDSSPLSEMNVYTDNKGMYRIEAEGFREEITCRLTASDIEGTYSDSEQIMNISWEGVSYDYASGTFVVNAEEFKLEKKK